MTVKYGFYNSLDGDRVYDANDVSTMFEGVFSDGVFESVGNGLEVVENTGVMGVLVRDGRAWFNDTWIRNTSNLSLVIEPSHLINDRIDLVILEFDSSIVVRQNSIKVITGTPAAIPSPPTLIHTSTLNQYTLAEVYVNAGVTEIELADITNKVGTVDTPYAATLLSEAVPTYAINDFQLGDGFGNWVKKTLAETVTVLRTILDGIYSAIGHSHSGLVIPYSNIYDVFRCANPGFASTFAALLNGNPTNVANSVCTFDTVSAGGVGVLIPFDSNALAKIRMYNITRGNYALVLTAAGSTFTTTTNVFTALGWRDNDVVNITSQIIAPAGFNVVDLEIIEPGLMTKSILFLTTIIANATAGMRFTIAPAEAVSASKYKNVFAQAASINNEVERSIKMNNGNVLCMFWDGTPSLVVLRAAGYSN